MLDIVRWLHNNSSLSHFDYIRSVLASWNAADVYLRQFIVKGAAELFHARKDLPSERTTDKRVKIVGTLAHA